MPVNRKSMEINRTLPRAMRGFKMKNSASEALDTPDRNKTMA